MRNFITPGQRQLAFTHRFGGESQAIADVVGFEVRIGVLDLVGRNAVRDHADYSRYRNAQAAHAWDAAHLIRGHGDSRLLHVDLLERLPMMDPTRWPEVRSRTSRRRVERQEAGLRRVVVPAVRSLELGGRVGFLMAGVGERDVHEVLRHAVGADVMAVGGRYGIGLTAARRRSGPWTDRSSTRSGERTRPACRFPACRRRSQ